MIVNYRLTGHEIFKVPINSDELARYKPYRSPLDLSQKCSSLAIYFQQPVINLSITVTQRTETKLMCLCN